MLDLTEVGALLSGSMTSEVAGEVMPSALQPWLETSALGPCQEERGMELGPCPGPPLTCQPGLDQGPWVGSQAGGRAQVEAAPLKGLLVGSC